MINLSPELCFKLRDARKAAKLSQGELAAELGCKQSAISMFEQGRPTKLNDEVVEKFAAKFSVDIKVADASGGDTAAAPVVVQPADEPGSGFCPNPDCPGHHKYTVSGRVLRQPDRQAQDPVGARYCALCGEVLERRCPNCGARVHAGAICSHCGEPYLVI